MNQVMEERESFKERGLERHRERFGGGGKERKGDNSGEREREA